MVVRAGTQAEGWDLRLSDPCNKCRSLPRKQRVPLLAPKLYRLLLLLLSPPAQRVRTRDSRQGGEVKGCHESVSVGLLADTGVEAISTVTGLCRTTGRCQGRLVQHV